MLCYMLGVVYVIFTNSVNEMGTSGVFLFYS